MKNRFLTVLALIAAVSLPLGAEAATAKANVTVNIVPNYSLDVSDAAVFSADAVADGAVKLSTEGEGSAARLKVNNNNRSYSVSVSLKDASDAGTKAALQGADPSFKLERGESNEYGEHELVLGGSLQMQEMLASASQSEPVYIVMNFN